MTNSGVSFSPLPLPLPLFLFLLSPQLSRCQNIEICAETPLKRFRRRLAIPAGDHWIPRPVPLDLTLSPPNGGAELSCLVSLHKYSCSSVISTLEGIGLPETMRCLWIMFVTAICFLFLLVGLYIEAYLFL